MAPGENVTGIIDRDVVTRAAIAIGAANIESEGECGLRRTQDVQRIAAAAAAAAHALSEQTRRCRAARVDIAAMIDSDGIAGTTRSAIAANLDQRCTRGIRRARRLGRDHAEIHPGIAASATYALRHQTGRVYALGRYPVLLQQTACHEDSISIAATAGKTANAERDRATLLGDSANDIHPALAATAANALGDDPRREARAEHLDPAIAVQGDDASIGTLTT